MQKYRVYREDGKILKDCSTRNEAAYLLNVDPHDLSGIQKGMFKRMKFEVIQVYDKGEGITGYLERHLKTYGNTVLANMSERELNKYLAELEKRTGIRTFYEVKCRRDKTEVDTKRVEKYYIIWEK